MIKSRDACLYMKSPTVLFLFEHCINHVYFELCQKIHFISEKFKQFVTYLRQNCTNKCDAAIILHKIYKNSLIHCELIAYALNKIVHNALHE